MYLSRITHYCLNPSFHLNLLYTFPMGKLRYAIILNDPEAGLGGPNGISVTVTSWYHVISGDMMIRYGSVFRKREASLMKICDWDGMSDDKWTTVLKVLTYEMFCPLKEHVIVDHLHVNDSYFLR